VLLQVPLCAGAGSSSDSKSTTAQAQPSKFLAQVCRNEVSVCRSVKHQPFCHQPQGSHFAMVHERRSVYSNFTEYGAMSSTTDAILYMLAMHYACDMQQLCINTPRFRVPPESCVCGTCTVHTLAKWHAFSQKSADRYTVWQAYRAWHQGLSTTA
jgi:hypothetical protein